MQCPRCHVENRDGRRFCGGCGLSFAVVCLDCGFSNDPSEKFCGGCGRSLAGGPLPSDLRFISPHAYTPKHLAEKILKSALEGERKQVTVLFADMKGSTELLVDRDPEEARKVLDPVLERMMDAVHRYGGTVNQVMGDGVMVLFGAPIAQEDHAVRACYAALRMQESIKRYAFETRRTVAIRIGLNSGEVVVRSIGSDLRMDYTAVGQTTHLAARMEQAAVPGTSLITADTFRLAEGYVQARSLEPIAVKGIAEPVSAYELVGATTRRTRLQVSSAGKLAHFVGRNAELDHLRLVLERAAQRHGQIVALAGDAGVGKSRLVHEFIHSPHTQGWLILESRSVSYGKATPYGPLIDLLKSYFQIQDDDDVDAVRGKLSARLASLEEAWPGTLAAFLGLLDLSPGDRQWKTLDPLQRRKLTLEACKRLMIQESRTQPLLLVFEDLQWIDSETQAFLDDLVESLPAARILLLVNYRSEYRHKWAAKTFYRQLPIDPLPPSDADEFFRRLLGEDHSLQSLKRLLVEKTEGNPLFLEECVRSLSETGVLTGVPGAYRLIGDVQKVRVPATVQAILAARIDRLPAEDKRLLQAASVIGKDVPIAVLEAVADLPEDDLRSRLANLQEAEFLYEGRLFPDLEYTFKHALTHEVAYGTLLQTRRRVLHADITHAIETLYAERLVEQSERLAHHALLGEVWSKAVMYLRQAGARALALSANREASTFFQQALSVLQRLPQDRETLASAIDLQIDLRNALLPLGEPAGALQQIESTERMAKILDDPSRLGWVSAMLAHYFWRIGEQHRTIELGERALTLSRTAGDLALEVSAKYYLGLAYHALGQYDRAMQMLANNLEVLQGDLLLERFGMTGLPSIFCRKWWAWCAAETGMFSAGLAHANEGLRIAEAADRPYSLIFACRGVSHIHLGRGEPLKAIAILERALKLCETWGFPGLLAGVAPSLGHAYVLCGRVAEGVALLEAAIAQATSNKLMFSVALWLGHLAQGYLLSDRGEQAWTTAVRAIEVARASGERGHEAWAVHHLAEIAGHSKSTRRQQAEPLYHEALDLAGALGMKPLTARNLLGLGVLLSQANRDVARSHLETAGDMFLSMEMTAELAMTKRELMRL